MPSPFPGMDPYLESHWRDVHSRLIVYLADAIQDGLPSALRARIEERVVMELPDVDDPGRYPDVRVVEYLPDAVPVRPRLSLGTAVAEPILLETAREHLTETFIEIIDVESGNKVVTVIEVLSPTNKTPGEGMKSYQSKQHEVCDSDTSLVEIDLLRGGEHVLAIPLQHIPSDQRTPYMICVRRAWVKGMAEVYPMPLPHPLPAIKIPLRQTDEDVVIALQPLVELCYRRGGYEGTINYNQDPRVPFAGWEAEWADRLLREAGRRTTPPAKGKRKRPKKPRR